MSERKYSDKDVDMLHATATIIEHAINNKTFLQSKRSTWADPFFSDLAQRIDNAFRNYLGIDNAKQMRAATRVVLTIQAIAIKLLAEFKVQIEEDFKNDPDRRDEIINVLGFTTHLKDVQNHDQEALVELLMKFKLNMDNALETEITGKGMAPQTIKDIIAQADILKNANITQETFKTGRPEISATAVDEFNEIHSAVMSVARISYNFFKEDKEKQQLFSYNRTINGLNSPQPTEEEPPPPSQ